MVRFLVILCALPIFLVSCTLSPQPQKWSEENATSPASLIPPKNEVIPPIPDATVVPNIATPAELDLTNTDTNLPVSPVSPVVSPIDGKTDTGGISTQTNEK